MEQLPLWVKMIICVVICELIGISSGWATASSISEWYVTLEKPFFNPPNWIFAPVWTLLYALMGIAAALVWDKGIQRSDVKAALGVFAIQLLLNAGWSLIFFGMRNPALALVEILLLLVVLFITIRMFWRIRNRAGALLLPYLIWVSFATILNGSIWYLNGGI